MLKSQTGNVFILRLFVLFLIAALPTLSLADRAEALREQATNLRSVRDRLDAAPADADLYKQYFEAFPATFADLRQMLVEDQYRDVLLHSGEQWNYGLAYIVPMCRTYDHVGHRQYLRKLLRIGIEAGDWGAKEPDDRYAGDIYQRLIARYPCANRTQQDFQDDMSTIYDLLLEFSDAEVTAIYHSMWWDEGDARMRLDWFLDGICSRDPARCELSRTLRDSFPEESSTSHD